MGTHREGGVEQQHPLVRPTAEVAAGERDVAAEVAVDFLNDVDKRGWHRRALLHRETETVGLSGFVIGVLPENNDFHLAERSAVEGVEDVFATWITDILLSFAHQEFF